MGAMFMKQPTGELTRLNKTEYDSEKILQELIANFPDILAGEVPSEDPQRWMLVKRELGIPIVMMVRTICFLITSFSIKKGYLPSLR